MTKKQTEHLEKIIKDFERTCRWKYRKGQKEHGGNLFDLTIEQLMVEAYHEIVDLWTYLVTLKFKLEEEGNAPNQSLDTQKEIRRILSKLDLCNCGGPEVAWVIVKALLERSSEESKSFYDPMLGAPGNWVEFGAKVLDSHNLLEHGSGIGSAWITDDGKLLLEFLTKFGVNPDNWPEWAYSEDFQGDKL